MAIQRWEMLLSAQADCYLLKIQGDRADADKIIQAHPNSCQSLQEISGDVFQWVIFVVDAPLAERLSIQNQVMSLTKDTSGATASVELGNILDGLSGALQDLTNLTEDEQAFVMNKIARMGAPAAPTPTAIHQTPFKAPSQTPAVPPSPGVYPPAGSPLPRVTIPGRPGTPTPARPPSAPAGSPAPVSPTYPGPGTPLPSPGTVPHIVRPVQPPRSFPGAPHMPGTPMPSVPMPKITPPPMAVPKPPIPAVAKVAAPLPIPQVLPTPPKPVGEKGDPPHPLPVQIPKTTLPAEAPVSASRPPHPDLTDLNSELNTLSEMPLTPGVEPLAYTPPRASPPSSPPPPESATGPAPVETPASVPVPQPIKPDDNAVLRISIFYPAGQEATMDQFLKTLTDVAQKKSKRPTAFQVALSVPTEISLENSTEWIWKAKTSGSDIFFVILPEGLGSEIMDPVVGEAQAAGLRCFLVPQVEVVSKLLYMDLMVELMMFKRRVRPTP